MGPRWWFCRCSCRTCTSTTEGATALANCFWISFRLVSFALVRRNILISCLGIHFYKMYKFKLPLYTWCSVKYLLERGQMPNLFHLLQHRKIGAAVLCHNAALRLSHCVGCKMDCRIRTARTSVQKVVLSLCCHSLIQRRSKWIHVVLLHNLTVMNTVIRCVNWLKSNWSISECFHFPKDIHQ